MVVNAVKSKFDRFLYEHNIQLKTINAKIKELGYTSLPEAWLCNFKNRKVGEKQTNVNITLMSVMRLCSALTAITGDKVTPNDILDYEKSVDKGMINFRNSQQDDYKG